MIETLFDKATLSAWPLDRQTRSFVTELTKRYGLGLPPLLDGVDNRPLRAEHLLNDDLDLDLIEHPAVLAVMAIADPFVANAAAATARVLPRVAGVPQADAMARSIAQVSRHDRVREGAAMIADYAFSPSAIEGLRWLARRSVDDDRSAAQRELLAYLDALAVCVDDPVTLIDDLFIFEYRLALSPAVFRRMVLNLVQSRKVALPARLRLIYDLQRLPRQLRLEVVMQVSLMPANTADDAAVRRTLEDVLHRMVWPMATPGAFPRHRAAG